MMQKLLVGPAKSLWIFVLLMILAVFFPGIGYTAIYDLKNDWSDSLNPNGVWTYRQGDTALPLQLDWDGDGTNSQKAWAEYNDYNHVPVWLKLDSGYYDLVTGDIVVHPTSHTSSSSQAPVNVIWTSPIDGTIAISGNIWWGGWETARYTDWKLYLNGTLLDFGTVSGYDLYCRDNPMLINGGGTLNVNAGDFVMLELAEHEGIWSWMTGVNLTIDAQPVPLPSSMLLLGTGLAAFGGIKRRKRGSSHLKA